MHGFNLMLEGVPPDPRHVDQSRWRAPTSCLVTSGEGVPTSARSSLPEVEDSRAMSGFLLPDRRRRAHAPFWDGLPRGELPRAAVQRESGALVLAAAPDGPDVAARSTYEWVPVSGRGTVWSFVVPHPPLLPAYAELAPYNVIVVALDEDPTLRMVGNLVASADAPINSIDPHTIEIGEPVQVVFSPGRGHDPPPLGPRPSRCKTRRKPGPRGVGPGSPLYTWSGKGGHPPPAASHLVGACA